MNGRPTDRDYPAMTAMTGRAEPAPRRVRGVLAGVDVFVTTSAMYAWDSPKYPWYVVPRDDLAPGAIVGAGVPEATPFGPALRHDLAAGDREVPGAALVYGDDATAALSGGVQIRWDALDAWYEEDEEIFVHPRNPYTRVDALRSDRHVRVELDGVLLAESSAPVLLFETGLPTRYYLEHRDVRFEALEPSDEVSQCPYKGRTSRYWSVRTPSGLHPDLAWSYDFPTRALSPIAGLVAFYNERVDITVDGRPLDRPVTHFS